MQQGREPFGFGPRSWWCRAGAGARQGAVPLPFEGYPSSFPLHRMKRIPSGRRQKMGHRHEPPASGLGWEAPRGLEVGVGTARVQPPFTWLPALGPAPERPPSLPSLLMPTLQSLPSPSSLTSSPSSYLLSEDHPNHPQLFQPASCSRYPQPSSPAGLSPSQML